MTETFGKTAGTRNDLIGLEDAICGSRDAPANSGTAESISGYIFTSVNVKIKCALYNYDTNAFVGETEEKTINTGSLWSWETFNFSAPKPSLTSGQEYWIVAWSEEVVGASYIGQETGDGPRIKDAEAYNDFPAEIDDADIGNDRCFIYCTYTPGVDHTHTPADTLSISDAVVYVLTKGAVPVVKRHRMPYGLKPARVPKVGRIGV